MHSHFQLSYPFACFAFRLSRHLSSSALPLKKAPLTQRPDIQSALHQTKRRFTDYVFQRVTISSSGTPEESDASTTPPAAQRLLRSPRSVSSLQIPNRRAAAAQNASSNGVPKVRATSPGAEIREAQRVAAARKEADEKRQHALQGHPASQIDSQHPSSTGGTVETASAKDSGSPPVPSSPRRIRPIRRFQISKSIGSNLGALRASGAGIQKRRADGPAPGVAVLVEQLQRKPHSRQASLIADIVNQAQTDGHEDVNIKPSTETESAVKPRKRPVVNQAEKKWKEERQNAISAAKIYISETLEKSAKAQQSTWDEESERLAKQFEQVAFEIERDMEMDPPTGIDNFAPPSSRPELNIKPPQPLKYQPRPPKQPRAVPKQGSTTSTETQSQDAAQVAADYDNDNDYVYDVYIRRPLAEMDMLTNPLAQAESDQYLKTLEAPNSGIGVIVITAEDEEYWEHFVEDDEEEWDSEDADSNGELRCVVSDVGNYN